MQRAINTDLYKAMESCGRYENGAAIIERIEEMREEAADGGDPEEILHEEGFEPDYIFDILDF